MPQLFCQLASRPGPWLLGRTSAGLCTLQTACPLVVTYSGGSPAADTIAAGSAATVYGGSAAAFDAGADVWVVLTVPGSGALQVVKEADLATVTGDWAGLARVVQHSTEPYQPQAYLGAGGLGAPAGTTVTAISDTAALAFALWNGSSNDAPPASWQTSGFDDSAWPHAVITADDGVVYVTGAHTIWPPGTVTAGSEQALLRQHVGLPLGTIASAQLVLYIDYVLKGLYVNGTALGGVSLPRTFTGPPYLPITLSVPPADLVAGADNVLALWAEDDVGPITSGDPTGNFAYVLTVQYAGAGGVLPAPSGPAEGDLLYYHSGAWQLLPSGTNGDELTMVSGDPAWTAQPTGASAGLYTAYLCYQDQEAQNTQGGTFTSGAWRTRVLTTEVADTGNHGTLASNQVTLDAGTYRVQASAPAYSVANHQARLQNITDSTTLATGSSEYTHATGTDFPQTSSLVVGRFTLGATKVIELQHRCTATQNTYGFGNACNVGTEVYAQLELFKE